MIINELEDKKDILILLMIQEREKQIQILEQENSDIKRLLIDLVIENKNLTKKIKKLSRLV